MITLNGNWQFKDFLDEDWRRRGAHLPDSADPRWWHTGSVPGSVHADLFANGLIPDPYFERNSELVEWVAQRSWVYRRTFVADPAWRRQHVQLCFDGIDYAADIYLNGHLLGSHASLFIPATFAIDRLIDYSRDNTLAVVLHPAPQEQSQHGRTSLVRTHKSRMGYGWDFCPRLVHLGIWRGVSLRVTGKARIEDVWVRSSLISDFTEGGLSIEVSGLADSPPVLTAQLFDPDGALISETVISTDRISLRNSVFKTTIALEVDDPKLWWPNGYGEQPLYRLVVSADGNSDQRTVTFGIRQLEWMQNDTPDDRALPYTPVVNGRKLYIKGWNWVPEDVLIGTRNPTRLTHLLHLAQAAHVNLLRVNGVGLQESPEFYELCDQLGILVWQEFTLSSSSADRIPASDSDYIDQCVREAETAVRLRRNHASLAVWCGGNELESLGFLPLDESHPVLAAQADVVRRLDPDRHYLPTSASGPLPFNGINDSRNRPLDLHDVHGPWHYQGLTGQYTLANNTANLLHSEFGGEGLSNRRAIERVISAKHRYAISRDNPVWYHLGAAYWVDEDLWRPIWGELSNLAITIRASQFIQAEAVQSIIDANRRRKFRNSGSLPWQFNEPYPMAANTSAVDYFGQPKPLYYAVKRAYAPVRVSAAYPTLAWGGRDQFETIIWGVSSLADAVSEQLTVRVIGLDGAVWCEQVVEVGMRPNTSAQLTTLTYPIQRHNTLAFFLDVKLGEIAHSRYLFSIERTLAAWLNLPATTLAISGKPDALTLTNSGSNAAAFVWLEGAEDNTHWSDNHFHLLPGETRIIASTSSTITTVQAWNTPRYEVTP